MLGTGDQVVCVKRFEFHPLDVYAKPELPSICPKIGVVYTIKSMHVCHGGGIYLALAELNTKIIWLKDYFRKVDKRGDGYDVRVKKKVPVPA